MTDNCIKQMGVDYGQMPGDLISISDDWYRVIEVDRENYTFTCELTLKLVKN